MAIRCVTLHAAKAHEPTKGVVVVPGLVELRGRVPTQHPKLVLHLRLRERYEHIGATQVAIPLRDLVLQDEVVTERVPGEVRDGAVTLVPVMALVGQYKVRIEL